MLRRTLSHRILLLTVAAAALVFTPAAAGTADPDAFSAGRNAAAWSVHARLPDARTPAAGPLIAAHRGASKYAPENTMAAFRLAETMGANFIELDVRATRDGRLIALHDETVDRTTNGKGRAGELTFGEIRRLDAGGWFSPAFRGERIPSLEEVLDRFGGGIGLILELKQPSAYPGIEQALARLLTERDWTGRSADGSSFSRSTPAPCAGCASCCRTCRSPCWSARASASRRATWPNTGNSPMPSICPARRRASRSSAEFNPTACPSWSGTSMASGKPASCCGTASTAS